MIMILRRVYITQKRRTTKKIQARKMSETFTGKKRKVYIIYAKVFFLSDVRGTVFGEKP